MDVTFGAAVSATLSQIAAVSGLPPKDLEKTAEGTVDLFDRLIARRGQKPNGLLLGKVQSGKTTAMMLLAAAAKDRGEKVVVVLLGTTNLLYRQNRRRLNDAFGIGAGQQHWHLLEPRKISTSSHFAKKTIESGRTILVPILKHHKWIERTEELVAELNLKGRLTVIDDESDIASIGGDGSYGVGEMPPTSAALRKLLGREDEGIYVHVTATPYAPLLLRADDRLAPSEFALINPGTGYVGSQEFFVDDTAAVRRVVSIDEISQVSLGRTGPALASAFGLFVATSIKAKIINSGLMATSMLIHPSASLVVHRRVQRAIEQLIAEWEGRLLVGDIPKELEQGCFVAALPPNAVRLRNQLGLVRVHVVNANGADQINWSDSPAHVLIGGNKLSRGFTVEGLTVTFLARKPSQQADTMLQRARFYGYRIGLGGLMHLFASKASMETWGQAARIEKQLWDRLGEIKQSGGGIADLRRLVNTGSALSATAQGGGIVKVIPSPWYPAAPPAREEWRELGNKLKIEMLAANISAVQSLLEEWPLGSEKTEVRYPAFSLPMVHTFIERLKRMPRLGVISEMEHRVRIDKRGKFIGVLADPQYKNFQKSTPCGIFLANIATESDGNGYLPILYIAGGSVTANQ